MTTIEAKQVGEYKYVRYNKKKDGSMGKTIQVIPKKKVISRELIQKYKEDNVYVYVYKTLYADGEVKNITMKRKYEPKKSKKDKEKRDKEIEKIEQSQEEKSKESESESESE